MWLLTVILTIILWWLIDNILIAAILAIFAVYSYTLVRALYLVKQADRIAEAVHPNKATETVHAEHITEVVNTTKKEVNTEEVDTSYIDFMEDNYKR